MEEVFRGGTLDMSSGPIPGLDAFPAWGDLLTNRILAVIAIFTLLTGLPDLFRLAPQLLYSFDRPRGAAALEHSLGMARIRNLTALACILPFCLMADRYALLRPAFWTHIPAPWSAPATVGLFIAFLLVREIFYLICRPRRLSTESYLTLKHNPYNSFILLTALMLVSIGILSVLLHLTDPAIQTVLRVEIAVIYLFALLRSGQILGGFGIGFTTILYLCGLEIIPAALMVAVVMFF
ncbi:MAG: hypothetical protein IJU34_10055 [Bacteroidales bacterium]|nr:hypothetical protein [Bacteroidales bacterium]